MRGLREAGFLLEYFFKRSMDLRECRAHFQVPTSRRGVKTSVGEAQWITH